MDKNILPLNVKVSRGIVNGQMYDVVNYDQYAANPEAYTDNTGIIMNYKGNDIILPLKGAYSGNPTSPGIYNTGPVDFTVYPNDNNIKDFVPEKIIEMSNISNIKEILEKEETLSRLSEPWITSPDSITKFPIQEDDHPEMKCLKTALNEKEIDFDKYAVRFGDNFPNDKRQLKNNGATLNIIKRFCDNLDMEALLILRDKNDNVPNPIGREIIVSLTDENE